MSGPKKSGRSLYRSIAGITYESSYSGPLLVRILAAPRWFVLPKIGKILSVAMRMSFLPYGIVLCRHDHEYFQRLGVEYGYLEPNGSGRGRLVRTAQN